MLHYFTRTIQILFFHLLLGGSAPTMLHVSHLAITDELYKSHSSNHDHGITSSAGVSVPHVHVPVSHAPVSDAPSPCASAHCALVLYVPVQCAAFPSHWNVCNLLFTRPNTQQHFKRMALDTSAHIPWHYIPVHSYNTRYQCTHSLFLNCVSFACTFHHVWRFQWNTKNQEEVYVIHKTINSELSAVHNNGAYCGIQNKNFRIYLNARQEFYWILLT